MKDVLLWMWDHIQFLFGFGVHSVEFIEHETNWKDEEFKRYLGLLEEDRELRIERYGDTKHADILRQPKDESYFTALNEHCENWTI